MSDVAIVSLIGILGTLFASFGSIWLKDYLDRKRTSPADKAAKGLIQKLLEEDRFGWRTVDTLANVVGTDEATVRRLLLEIGARGSMKDGRLWGLLSRNPLTKDPLGDDPGIIEDPDSQD